MADTATPTTAPHTPWNKGKLIGQKPPLKLREVWTVRTRLQMAGNAREIALFNLAIDSKLRGCDLVRLMVRDLAHGSQVLARATVVQQKTKQPVRFEVTDQTREALTAWIVKAKLADGDYLFPSRQRGSPHLSTRQYARIVKGWIGLLGGDPQAYGTHSLRRTKATLIYRKSVRLAPRIEREGVGRAAGRRVAEQAGRRAGTVHLRPQVALALGRSPGLLEYLNHGFVAVDEALDLLCLLKAVGPSRA